MGVHCCCSHVNYIVYKLFEHMSALLAIKARVFVKFHTLMGLVLGQSLIVISTTGIMLYAKVSPLYNILWECIVVAYAKGTLFINI